MIRKPSPDDILAEVCDLFDLPTVDVLGGNKTTRAVQARWMFWLLCREMTALSYPEIARIGGNAHSSVMDGVQGMYHRIEDHALLSVRTCMRMNAATAHRTLTLNIRERCAMDIQPAVTRKSA